MANADRLRRALGRMRAVRNIGGKLIAFLAQLEDFQKRLWLKKKFVLETQWWRDAGPRAGGALPGNRRQRGAAGGVAGAVRDRRDCRRPGQRWLPQGEPFSSAGTHAISPATSRTGFWRRFPGSAHWTSRLMGFWFTVRIFRRLNLLQTRYRGEVHCTYIDPPYNTGDSEILYKNGYLRSSWLSLMSNNLGLTRNILANDSVFFIAIDDFEMVNLSKLIDNQCLWLRREMIIINHHPQGGKGKNASKHS